MEFPKEEISSVTSVMFPKKWIFEPGRKVNPLSIGKQTFILSSRSTVTTNTQTPKSELTGKIPV